MKEQEAGEQNQREAATTAAAVHAATHGVPPVPSWLDLELDRVWLLAERRLRILQAAGLRPAPTDASIGVIEAMLASRRLARGAAETADCDEVIAALARADAAVRQAQPSPLDHLSQRFVLRPLERVSLAFALAIAIDPPLSELCSLLRPAARGGVDLALVADVMQLGRAHRALLLDVTSPERPLLRWGLIQVENNASPWPSFRITSDTLSAIVAGELATVSKGCTTLRGARADFTDLALDEPLRAQLIELARMKSESALVLYGPRGAGKREIAARLAAHANRLLLAFDPRDVPKARLDELLHSAKRDALLANATLYVGPVPSDLPAADLRSLIHSLNSFAGPLAIGVETLTPPRLPLLRPSAELGILPPSESVRAELWRRSGAAVTPAVVRNYRLTPGEIFAIAQQTIGAANPEEALQREVSRTVRNELADLARRLPTDATWDDIVLPKEEVDRAREFVARWKHRDRVLRQWGFAAHADYGHGLIALLSGPPGTGKTMLARVIAGALGLELYQVDLSQVFSRWIGETEKALGRLFDQAERAHAVLLFDEADALFAKRTAVESSHDRYANLTVNYLLQRIEQYGGVAILTSNKNESLDDALARRLTLHLRLEEPQLEEREGLWQRHLPKDAPGVDQVDVYGLARDFMLSGGSIKNVALRAAFLAADGDGQLSTALLRRAAQLELKDLGRHAGPVAGSGMFVVA